MCTGRLCGSCPQLQGCGYIYSISVHNSRTPGSNHKGCHSNPGILAVLADVGFGVWTFEKSSNLVDGKGEVLVVNESGKPFLERLCSRW